MLFSGNKYLSFFMQHLLLNLVFLAAFTTNASAQNNNVKSDSNTVKLSPLLLSAFKKPLKANPLPAKKIKPSKFELMYWPNYPLTAAQIEARNKEWERRSTYTLGQQIVMDIAGDIIKNQINSLIYGKKMPVAVAPKF